jgi:hypothetical protein
MASTYAAFLGQWEPGYHVEADEYRELDDERVLVFVHNIGRGKASGIEIGQLMGVASGAHLFVIRGGKVVRFVHHWDRDLALADLGVKE